jgi:hypothetical protein
MIIVGEALLSEDILEAHFACQLQQCKGDCCVQGDVGAPLEEAEVSMIESELPAMMVVLPERSQAMLKSGPFWERDQDEEAVIRCHPDGTCVFAISEQGITLCGMEQAWRQGLTAFRKPISCHLYPIRSKNYGEFTVMNYHRWDICQSACTAGRTQEIPLFRFLKEALIRKMGPSWYAELEAVAAARASGSGL